MKRRVRSRRWSRLRQAVESASITSTGSRPSVQCRWTGRVPKHCRFCGAIGASADAVLVTSRPGRAVVGLSPGPTLDWAAQDAVVCAVTAYGLTGPQRHWRATPFTAFAGSGLMSVTGPVEGPPLAMPGAHMFDLAGVRAAYLVQASLLTGRDRVGGVSIDLSVHEAASWQKLTIDQFDTSGRIPDRRTNFGPPPGGVWQCRDGRVDIAAHALHHWSIFVDVLGRPDGAGRPTLRGPRDAGAVVRPADRTHHAVYGAMGRSGIRRSGAGMRGCRARSALSQARWPMIPTWSTGSSSSRSHRSELGSVRVPGHPFRSDPPLQVRVAPLGPLDADTQTLCKELGVSEEELSRWRAAGVV